MKSLVVKAVLPIILVFLFTSAYAQQKQAASGDAEFYYNRGAALGAMRQYDQVVSDFTRALEIDPRYAYAYVGRGSCYVVKGEYAKAWQDVEKAQSLGYQFDPGFVNELRRASGRQN